MEKIYSYTNYRKFLSDYYQDKKQNTSFFSFRYFSKKAGFSSPSLLKFVINGERNLAPESVEKFIEALGLAKNEGAYFRALVNFNQAKSEKLKNRHYEELLGLLPGSGLSVMERGQFQVYDEWYHIPVRELVALEDFQEDAKWIAGRLTPPIKSLEAERSLKLLKSLGFLKYNEDKRLVQSEPFITTGDEVKSLLIRKFHDHMIQLGRESIERFPKEEREISSLTVCVSEKSFREIKTRISVFEDELLEILSKSTDKCSYVYQLNFQFFPLARPKERDR